MDIIEQRIEEDILPLLTQETCRLLNNEQEALSEISWTSNEANLDKDFSELAKKCCETAFSKIVQVNALELEVNTPDLELTFRARDRVIQKKIELKSTKSLRGVSLGSTILGLNPNMWTIFCLRHPNSEWFKVRYGRYHLGIEFSDSEKFQDRSPRPRIDFFKYQIPEEAPKSEASTLGEEDIWGMYAKCAINRIENPSSYSWQDSLVKEIIRMVVRNPERFKNI